MIAMPRTQPIRYQKLFHNEVQHKAKIALLTSITCKCYTAYSQACTSYYRFICAFSQFTQHKKRKCVAIASADRDSRRNVPIQALALADFLYTVGYRLRVKTLRLHLPIYTHLLHFKVFWCRAIQSKLYQSTE
jgi:hypothetical protein